MSLLKWKKKHLLLSFLIVLFEPQKILLFFTLSVIYWSSQFRDIAEYFLVGLYNDLRWLEIMVMIFLSVPIKNDLLIRY